MKKCSDQNILIIKSISDTINGDLWNTDAYTFIANIDLYNKQYSRKVNFDNGTFTYTIYGITNKKIVAIKSIFSILGMLEEYSFLSYDFLTKSYKIISICIRRDMKYIASTFNALYTFESHISFVDFFDGLIEPPIS